VKLLPKDLRCVNKVFTNSLSQVDLDDSQPDLDIAEGSDAELVKETNPEDKRLVSGLLPILLTPDVTTRPVGALVQSSKRVRTHYQQTATEAHCKYFYARR
jgi:hypothetical protein